jgi:CheY-like chemotaxis protein
MTHLLVVDDNNAVRIVLRTQLEAMGWEVDEAESGEEALRHWRAARPDMVVLDQRMPGRSGLEVAKEMRNQGFEGRIILYSAYLTPDVQMEADAAGLVTVAKTDFSQLLTLLRRAAAGGLPRRRPPDSP